MGVQVTFVTAPKHPAFQALIDAEMPEEVATYRGFLAKHRVIDAADLNHQGWTDEQFIDAYHLAATEFALFNDLILQARGIPDHIGKFPKSKADHDDTTTKLLPAGREEGGNPYRRGWRVWLHRKWLDG
jgi:hypothetical protein